MTKKTTFTCAQCGATVTKPRNDASIYFCTKRCKGDYQSTNPNWKRNSLPPQGRGAKNTNWKGDAITIQGGRLRAIRNYPLTNCELCGAPGRDRHHKDGNTLNNAPDNIQRLCRRCHMTVDGRLSKFVARNLSGTKKGWAVR